MKKSSRLLMVILLLVSVALTACSGSASGMDRIKKAGKIVIAVDTTYPPMEYVENGKTVGFDVDLANAIAKKLGVQAEFQTVQWDGIIAGLKAKRYDIIMSSMNITDDRKKEANFVEYVRMSQVFVAKKGTNVASEKDLAGKVVLVQDGTTSHDWVKEAKEKRGVAVKEITSFSGATEAFTALKNGRGDVIVIDEPVGLYYAAKDAATFAITGRAMDPEPVGIAVRLEEKDLHAALDKAVKELQADGTLKKISEQWFGKELGK